MSNTWQKKKLGQVCKVVAGQSPEGKYYNKNGDGLPFYQGKKDYGPKYLNPPTVWTTVITKEAYQDDILMSVRAPVGPLNIATERICIGRGLAAIRAGKELDRNFLYFFLEKHEGEITGNAGAVFNSINKAQIESIELLLPPLPEQQRIVSILDEAFAAIAKAKANYEQNLKNGKELFESYLEEVFKKAGNEWELKTLNQISQNLDNKRIPITKNIRIAGKIPYYGASGIVDYVSDYIFDEDLLCVSEDGANLLARTYPIAFSISGKTWVNNHAHVLRFSNLNSQRFVEYYLNSIRLQDYVSGMAQPKLNQAMLNKIPVPWPSVKEQSAIIENLDKLSAKSKKLQSIYTKKIQDLDELKKALLQKAFSGELTAGIQQSIFAKRELAKVDGIAVTDLQAGITAIALQKHREAGRDNTFHHVKAEKIVHLAEYILKIDLDRQPVKDAAGPNDFPHAKKVESRASKAGFYTVIKSGTFYEYQEGRQFQSLISKTKAVLGEKVNQLNTLLELLVPMTTQQAEIVATVYAAWNNLLLEGKEISDESIVLESCENWHAEKLKIERPKFFKAISWMREKNIVPTGIGKTVISRK